MSVSMRGAGAAARQEATTGADPVATPGPNRPASTARRAAPPLPYMPALDGLRAVAVAGVFLFHGGVGWMTGGYLAVSTFFTLSGFLITTLLLGEYGRTRRIALGAFWERRIRRLLPAAVLGVALAAWVTLTYGDAVQQNAFAGDGVATLFDVANWRFVVAGKSYAQLFSAPSALQHAWSLAIEAQFYWIYPMIAAVVLRAVRGDRRRFGLVLAAMLAASLALTRFGGLSHDRIYYGTDTRAAELLAGALLGVLVSGRPNGALGPWSPPAKRAIRLGGSLAFAALILVWIVTPESVSWIDAGGLGVYAALSAVVVLAAAVPRTAVSAVLGARPLRALGRISYGVYLFHWPVLLIFSPARVPWPTVLRLAAAAAVTIGLAAASYRFVELPVRLRRGLLGRPSVGLVAASCAAIALVPTLVVARQAQPASRTQDLVAGALVSDVDQLGPPPSDLAVPAGPVGTAPGRSDRTPADGTGGAAPSTAAASAPSGPTPSTATTAAPAPPSGPLSPRPVNRPGRALRVLVVGDSTAVYLGPLLNTWGTQAKVWNAATYAHIGCGIVRGGDARNAFGEGPFDPVCASWDVEWPKLIDRVRPDLILLSSAFWDATDRRLPGDSTWRAPGDPVYDDAVRRDYAAALDVLSRTGAPVAWLDHPPVFFHEKSALPEVNPQVFDPARMDRLDELQTELVQGRPGVRVVRARPFYDAWPAGVFDPTLRPDGLHVDGPGAQPLIDWLGPEILDAYWSMPRGKPSR